MKKRLTIRFLQRFAVLLVIALSAFSVEGHAQDARRVTVRNATTLSGLISQIEGSSSYRFSWQDDLISAVSFPAVDMVAPIEEVLSAALRTTDIDFSIQQFNVILTKKVRQSAVPPPIKEKQTVTGYVKDAVTGEPMIGATVWLKDTSIGTSTDVNGFYSITFPSNYFVLSFSYLRYEAQEVVVGGRTAIDVNLVPSSNDIDDVVVVGYGRQKKGSVIGAISTVAINDIKAPVAKISNNLAGQLAGVVSVQRSGEPGAGSTFWIRGINTFGEAKSPLILVDGIERDLDLVNVDDIKEMSILKDASATAIYGVRGANGVVMITTRDGEVGKPRVSLSVEGGLVSPTKVPSMLNSVQFANMYNQAAGRKYYDDDVIERYRNGSDPDLYPNVDWLGELYKNHSWNEKVNLSVSGGGDIAKYYISGSFYNEDGLFAVDNMKNYDTSLAYQRYNFRSNVDVQIFPHTKLNINLGTSFERKNEPGGDTKKVWEYALSTAPNAFPLFYSDGSLAGPGNNQVNPYNELTQSGYKEKFWNTATSTVNLVQDFGSWITPGLTANVKVAFDAQNHQSLERTKQPPQHMALGRDDDGNLIFGEPTVVGQETLTYKEYASGQRSFYLEAGINYGRTFGKHTVGALFLYQQSQKNYTDTKNTLSEKALPYRHQGIAGRITYNFDNRYFIEGNFGYNGSENFSPNHRFGFFPAGAIGWLLSEEPFFEPLKDIFDMVKFKASYGIVGNDKIGGNRRFIYNETVLTSGAGSYQFGSTNTTYNGIRLGNWPNDEVGWEKAYKLNVGAEISLFGKLKMQADYFRERRDGIFLQSKSVPGIAGLSTQPWINVGKMKNHGVDASLEYYQQIGQVQLTMRGNFTYAHNIIVDNDEPAWREPYMNRVGQSNWQTFGLVAAGLFSSQEEIDGWPTQSWGVVQPGDIKYLDLNGDGKVDEYDVKPLGYPDVPEITYGFGASVKWKGFDFSVFFQGVGNVNFFANNTYTQPFTATNISMGNVFTDLVGNYWTPENLNAKYPRLTTSANENNKQVSSFWMVDGSYIRLKNAEIGYTLPKSWVNKMRIEGLRIYISGMNLLTFSDFKLWDPDLQTGAANYPNNKVYNIGLSLTF